MEALPQDFSGWLRGNTGLRWPCVRGSWISASTSGPCNSPCISARARRCIVMRSIWPIGCFSNSSRPHPESRHQQQRRSGQPLSQRPLPLRLLRSPDHPPSPHQPQSPPPALRRHHLLDRLPVADRWFWRSRLCGKDRLPLLYSFGGFQAGVKGPGAGNRYGAPVQPSRAPAS